MPALHTCSCTMIDDYLAKYVYKCHFCISYWQSVCFSPLRNVFFLKNNWSDERESERERKDPPNRSPFVRHIRSRNRGGDRSRAPPRRKRRTFLSFFYSLSLSLSVSLSGLWRGTTAVGWVLGHRAMTHTQVNRWCHTHTHTHPRVSLRHLWCQQVDFTLVRFLTFLSAIKPHLFPPFSHWAFSHHVWKSCLPHFLFFFLVEVGCYQFVKHFNQMNFTVLIPKGQNEVTCWKMATRLRRFLLCIITTRHD